MEDLEIEPEVQPPAPKTKKPKMKAEKKASATKKTAEKKSEEGKLTVIKESKKPIGGIMQQYVQMTKSGCGLKLAKDTPLPEFLPILDTTVAQKDRVGFFIGDLIIQARSLYGNDAYEHAINSTGRKLSTLKVYEEVSRAIPDHLRSRHLTFKHYREISHVPDPEKLKQLVEIAEHQEGDKVLPLTVKEFKVQVEKIAPKPKRAGGAGRPRGDGKAKKTKSPKGWAAVSPTFEESQKCDEVMDMANDLADKLEELGSQDNERGIEFLKLLGPNRKQPILAALKPIAELYAELHKTAGWGE